MRSGEHALDSARWRSVVISVSYLDAVPGTKARWPWLNRRVGGD